MKLHRSITIDGFPYHIDTENCTCWPVIDQRIVYVTVIVLTVTSVAIQESSISQFISYFNCPQHMSRSRNQESNLLGYVLLLTSQYFVHDN